MIIKIHNRIPTSLIVILIVLGIVGGLIIIYSTPYGLGLVNDSSAYVNGARNLLSGEGYSRTAGNGESVPLTHFPPLLSIVLATFGLFGIDAIQATKILNIFFFASNIFFAGLLLYKITGTSVFSILGAVLFLLSESFISIHTYALSEPFFIWQLLIILLLLYSYFKNSNISKVIVLGFLTGLIYLTRYLGVSVFGMIFISLILCALPAKTKVRHIVVYMLSSLVLPLIWSIRNTLLTGNFANRRIYYHPVEQHKWFDGSANFWDWLFPGNLNLYGISPIFFSLLLAVISICILVVILKGLWATKNRKKVDNEQLMIIAVAVESIVYLSVLIFSMTFVDPATVFENRMLAPFYFCLVLISVAYLSKMWKSKARLKRGFIIFISLILVVSFGRDSVILVSNLHQDGQGFANSWWRDPRMIEDIQSLPDVTLYSNRITALYLLTERPAYTLPSPEELTDLETKPRFQAELDVVRTKVLKSEAVIVIYGYGSYIKDPGYQDWVMAITDGLPVYSEYDNITVFGQLLE